MRVMIRTDASVAIGSGHAMRCLTLAGALRDQGAKVEFASRLLDGNLCDLIESRGFEVHRLPGATTVGWERDADETRHSVNAVQDWLVVDHYDLDADWERRMRGCAKRVLIIDDLANRPHDCEILLDQNYYLRPQDRYDGKVPPSCRLLLGPRYVLLAPQFEKEASSPRMRDGRIRRVLIFFGGSDPTGETEKALDAIKLLGWSNVHFDVVVGAGNPRKDLIQFRCGELPKTAYYCQTSDMARLCSLADVALGAGGSANWERFKLGLPSIVLVTADNQRETVKALAAGKYIHLLGSHEEINAESMAEVLAQMAKEPSVVRHLGKRALELMKTEAEGGVRLLVKMMCQV